MNNYNLPSLDIDYFDIPDMPDEEQLFKIEFPKRKAKEIADTLDLTSLLLLADCIGFLETFEMVELRIKITKMMQDKEEYTSKLNEYEKLHIESLKKNGREDYVIGVSLMKAYMFYYGGEKENFYKEIRSTYLFAKNMNFPYIAQKIAHISRL